ncbi:hypothetical protein DPEC_G00018580 [Dallia pectoralis]|uniref:Uncharacterized protein n=1 Tax=Dallia pectoralis TaxID=75939 RepID=A0ACC2HFG6_DALPE|nr:hypothetical protein DPEC_G00018580 [Dallia pectoralis]
MPAIPGCEAAAILCYGAVAAILGDGVAAILGDGVAAILGDDVAAILGDGVAAILGDGVAAILGDGVAAILGDGVAAILGDAVAAILGDGVAAILGDGVAAILGDGVAAILGDGVAAIFGDGVAAISLKYADDMAFVSDKWVTKALSDYHQTVNNLVTTFHNISLDLNIDKTKELCCQSRETKNIQDMFEPLSINGKPVERVNVFKYLGTEIDTSMSFSQHADTVYKKAQQRLHLQRKLLRF